MKKRLSVYSIKAQEFINEKEREIDEIKLDFEKKAKSYQCEFAQNNEVLKCRCDECSELSDYRLQKSYEIRAKMKDITDYLVKNEGHLYLASRGIGKDYGRCFICGKEGLCDNIAAYVKNREEGLAIRRLLFLSHLDWRVHELYYLQLKIMACESHKPQLQELNKKIDKYSTIHPQMIYEIDPNHPHYKEIRGMDFDVREKDRVHDTERFPLSDFKKYCLDLSNPETELFSHFLTIGTNSIFSFKVDSNNPIIRQRIKDSGGFFEYMDRIKKYPPFDSYGVWGSEYCVNFSDYRLESIVKHSYYKKCLEEDIDKIKGIVDSEISESIRDKIEEYESIIIYNKKWRDQFLSLKEKYPSIVYGDKMGRYRDTTLNEMTCNRVVIKHRLTASNVIVLDIFIEKDIEEGMVLYKQEMVWVNGDKGNTTYDFEYHKEEIYNSLKKVNALKLRVIECIQKVFENPIEVSTFSF